METKKKLRCPLGVPGGVLATLIGLVGIIAYTTKMVDFEWMGLLTSIALFLMGGPFVRVTMMIHSANDRLDALESKNEK